MVVSNDPTIVDFVVVIEATANMVTHWDVIKKSYIRPAVEHFTGKSMVSTDIGNNGNSHYGYVLLRSGDPSLEPMTTTAVIQSPSLFLHKLDGINFNGGGAERCCLVAEGLGRAMKVFDDLTNRRGQRDAMKVCVLVCNSPPYELPCYNTYEYCGNTYEELAKLMGSRGIHLSVISPHHIRQIKQIYMTANPNKSAMMNYAQDHRHLVLISGFDLPTEQEPVKVEPMDELSKIPNRTSAAVTSSVASPSVPPRSSPAASYSTNPISQSGPMMQTSNSQGLTIHHSPITSGIVSNQQNLPNMIPSNPIIKTDIEKDQSRMGFPQQRPANSTNFNVMNSQTGQNVTYSSATNVTQGILSGNSQASSNMLGNTSNSGSLTHLGGNQTLYSPQNNSGMNQPLVGVSSSSTAIGVPQQDQSMNSITNISNYMASSGQVQTSQPMRPQSGMMVMRTPNAVAGTTMAQTSQNQVHNKAPVMPQEKPTFPEARTVANEIMKQVSPRIIWAGKLEWNEKRVGTSGEEQRTLHSLSCEAMIRSPAQAEELLGTSSWPKTLTMQLVPRIILSYDEIKPHVRNAIHVTLKLLPMDQAQQLANLLNHRWMGVVHFTIQNPQMMTNESRVMLVLYSAKINQVMSIVSRDAVNLIGAIRQMLRMHKGQVQQSQPGQQNAKMITTPFNNPRPTSTIGGMAPAPNRMAPSSNAPMTGMMTQPSNSFNLQNQQTMTLGNQIGNPPIMNQPMQQPQQMQSSQGNQTMIYPNNMNQRPIIRRSIPTQHTRMRMPINQQQQQLQPQQQQQQPQISIGRQVHSGDGPPLRALLKQGAGNTMAQQMSQQQQSVMMPGQAMSQVQQPNRTQQFLQNQQMRQINNHGMGMGGPRY